MIGFQLANGDFISLNAKTKAEFSLTSGLFDDDIPGAYSTNLTISDTDGNYRKLGFPNRLDIYSRTIVHDGVRMVVNGRPEYSGKLFVKRNKADNITGFFIPNGFAADVVDKNLTDIDYGSDVVLGADTAAIVTEASTYVTENYPDVNFNFPMIYAPAFYDIENAIAWRSIANAEFYDDETEYDVNDYIRMQLSNSLDSYYRCVSATTAGQNPITNPAKWEEENGNCLLNNWDDDAGEFRSNDISGIEVFNKHSLSPQLFTKFILSRIGQAYGYQVIGEFMADANTDQAMTHNNVALDSGKKIYYVRASNDGIGPTACNNYGGSGFGLTYESLNSSKIVFNDETTAPNEDANGIYDGCDTSAYTIQNAGTHTITFNLVIGTNTTTFFSRVRIYFPYNTTAVNAGDTFNVIPAGFTGLFQYTYTYEASAADVGNHFYAEVWFQGSGSYIAFQAPDSYMIVENISATNMNRYKGTVHLADHVPDVSISDYLIGLKRRHNLNVIIDPKQKVIQLDYAKNILGRQADDYTNIIQSPTYEFQESRGIKIAESFEAEIDVLDGNGLNILASHNSLSDLESMYYDYELNDVVYSKSDNTLYRLGLKNSVTRKWFKLGNYYPDFVYGDGKRALDMIGAPFNMETIWQDGDAITVPRMDILGSSDLFGMGRNDCPLIFSFWRGMQDSQNGEYSYPFCSPHPYKPDGTLITGGIDLRFTDDDYSVWNEHKEWLRRVDQTVKVYDKSKLTIKQIFEWTFRNPMRIRYNNLIREKLIYSIDQNDNVDAEIQAYKIMP